jgi:putative DNA primase/helicase
VNNIEAKPFKQLDIDVERRRQSLNEVWAGANDALIAGNYLRDRGVPPEIISEVRDVRGHPRLFYTDTSGPHNVLHVPAMVALIRNAKGQPISIHRTYFTVGGKQKKVMPPLEPISGACVRLGEPDKTLAVAEGIETALAMWAVSGVPTWATISAHGMEEFKSIPRHVDKVIICADNDLSFTGQGSAFKCAHYMKHRLKVDAEVWMPAVDGMDMLDHLQDLSGDKKSIMKWRGR